ncbi:MAG: hypothetical protein IT299_07445 [Dehalococcoidia bacterium]|nr:hypothetical protein [Dehalococcoidia bacterium]
MKLLTSSMCAFLLLASACSEVAPPVARSTPTAVASMATPPLVQVPTSEACPVTRAVPPEEVPADAARPILSGSSHPEVVRANLSMAGNDALWVTLPRGAAPLEDRAFVVRLVAGQVSASARRLDGAAPPATFHIPAGYGPEGLQVVGITFPTPGCWEITYRLEGATPRELRVTMLVVPAP